MKLIDLLNHMKSAYKKLIECDKKPGCSLSYVFLVLPAVCMLILPEKAIAGNYTLNVSIAYALSDISIIQTEGSVRQTSEAQFHYEAALEMLKSNHVQSAVNKFELSLYLSPNFPKAQYYLGYASYMLSEFSHRFSGLSSEEKSYRRAIAEFEKFIESYPSHEWVPFAYYFLYRSYHARYPVSYNHLFSSEKFNQYREKLLREYPNHPIVADDFAIPEELESKMTDAQKIKYYYKEAIRRAKRKPQQTELSWSANVPYGTEQLKSRRRRQPYFHGNRREMIYKYFTDFTGTNYDIEWLYSRWISHISDYPEFEEELYKVLHALKDETCITEEDRQSLIERVARSFDDRVKKAVFFEDFAEHYLSVGDVPLALNYASQAAAIYYNIIEDKERAKAICSTYISHAETIKSILAEKSLITPAALKNSRYLAQLYSTKAKIFEDAGYQNTAEKYNKLVTMTLYFSRDLGLLRWTKFPIIESPEGRASPKLTRHWLAGSTDAIWFLLPTEWGGGRFAAKIDKSSGILQIHEEEGAPRNATCILNTNHGVWVGTSDQGLYRYIRETESWMQYSAEDGLLFNRVDFLEAHDESVWAVVGNGRGVVRHDIASQKWYYCLEDAPLEVMSIRSIAVDNDSLWIVKAKPERGLWNYDKIDATGVKIVPDGMKAKEEELLFMGNDIPMTVDDTFVWVASLSGVARYNKYNGKWKFWQSGHDAEKINKGKQLPDFITDIKLDGSDVWVIAGYGLYRYSKDEDIWDAFWRASTVSGNFIEADLTAVILGKEHLWCGTNRDGLIRFTKP